MCNISDNLVLCVYEVGTETAVMTGLVAVFCTEPCRERHATAAGFAAYAEGVVSREGLGGPLCCNGCGQPV